MFSYLIKDIEVLNTKKLRLKFEFIDSGVLSSDLFANKLASNVKLNELINLLFDVLSKYDSNLALKNNFNNHTSYDINNNNSYVVDYLLK